MELKINYRVLLHEFKDEQISLPEQTATVVALEEKGLICVRLDKEFRENAGDDGLRELSPSQVKEVIYKTV